MNRFLLLANRSLWFLNKFFLIFFLMFCILLFCRFFFLFFLLFFLWFLLRFFFLLCFRLFLRLYFKFFFDNVLFLWQQILWCMLVNFWLFLLLNMILLRDFGHLLINSFLLHSRLVRILKWLMLIVGYLLRNSISNFVIKLFDLCLNDLFCLLRSN